MRDVRPAAVAGMFYPGSPAELAATVRGCLSEALRPAGAPAGVPKALIVPHAGYVYSGPIAAESSFRRPIRWRSRPSPRHPTTSTASSASFCMS